MLRRFPENRFREFEDRFVWVVEKRERRAKCRATSASRVLVIFPVLSLPFSTRHRTVGDRCFPQAQSKLPSSHKRLGTTSKGQRGKQKKEYLNFTNFLYTRLITSTLSGQISSSSPPLPLAHPLFHPISLTILISTIYSET